MREFESTLLEKVAYFFASLGVPERKSPWELAE